MTTFVFKAEAGTPRLLTMFPWIAELPTGQSYCHGATRSGRCKKYAKYLYVNLDGGCHYFCRDHLDTHRCQASVYNSDDDFAVREEKRMDKWFKKNAVEIATEIEDAP